MMKSKIFNFSTMCLLVVCIVLSGCSAKKSDSSASIAPTDVSTAAPTAAATEASTPAPVDNSKKIKIELMESGWVNTPLDDKDPFKKWIDDKYNVDFKLTNVAGADFETKLLTRFSSNEPPDLIFIADRNLALKLYNQGVLLDDWKPLLDKVPTVAASTGDLAKQYVTMDDKMYALPKQPDANTWSMKIRLDWLKKLNLTMPQTDAELLDVLQKFALNDPDGDGKANTYGITTAGGGTSLAPIFYLESMYGQTGFLMTDNKADHSILNGTHKKYLDFMKKLVDTKAIDPDWYTQNWAQHLAKVDTDKIGVYQCPSACLATYETDTKNTGKGVDIWGNLPMPKGTDTGGKNMPAAVAGGMYVISDQASKDPDKLNRILQVIDGSTYPNSGYFTLRWGDGITGESMTDMDNGAKYFVQNTTDKSNYRVSVPGAWDYGTWIATGNDKVLQGTEPKAGPVQSKMLQLDQETIKQPVYQDFQSLLNLDTQLVTDTTTLQNAFDIKYILGTEKDYDAFKTKWLAAGGQKLLDNVGDQFKKLGYIK